MAKLAVLFVFSILLIQYAAAGKIKRDAPAADNNIQQNLEEALKNLQNAFTNAFSKDQIEAFSKQMQQFSETIGEKGKEFIDAANANIEKLKAQPKN